MALSVPVDSWVAAGRDRGAMATIATPVWARLRIHGTIRVGVALGRHLVRRRWILLMLRGVLIRRAWLRHAWILWMLLLRRRLLWLLRHC